MRFERLRFRGAAPLAAFLALAALGAATIARDGEDVPATPIEAGLAAKSAATPTTWAEIHDNASALLGRRVRFVVQFKEPVPAWRAYQSRFGPRTHLAFQAWADEQFLWLREQHDAPLVRCFVRRGSYDERTLEAAGTYQRFEVVGTLRELFLGVPWVEVEELRGLPERVGEGVVIHAARAVELIREESWALAQAELQQALQATLPAPARRELERLLQGCRDAQGR